MQKLLTLYKIQKHIIIIIFVFAKVKIQIIIVFINKSYLSYIRKYNNKDIFLIINLNEKNLQNFPALIRKNILSN